MTEFLWAQDRNGVIGKDGRLPWHLPDDLHYFRAQTVGKIMVVGRRTYESFPKRPLPERTNVVLTYQANYQAPGAVVLHDVSEVFAYAKQHPDQDLVIAGGAQIFTAFKDDVDTLLVTRLDGSFDGDTKMIPLDWDAFTKVSSRTVEDANPDLTHTYEVWKKKA
ncbi:dihydrofolate reductase [Lacticaseibacillus chiayiensis]|uniref:Dihydrofolate reductase n=1 Tax=Lacticaseibacillus chiayiensis TaxID=2100821 RepID=A0A4Q1TND9_9LACO|nr:dihydrofolate reductase [Lacticaseibacillus chiayiensis]QVI35854.1 dihydrofolate reductase [Lacticaseibacillus chiayiensis]RXT19933.1 dihydrofolate reductase [Lacticaseibacillus chiayiensis]RXT58675.1 dihydrofolate reductase [Lacticaseibacillus chiayiensis]UYN57694.1 dihydrofolate reductase [Lacticaseibacillus chiayiensis]